MLNPIWHNQSLAPQQVIMILPLPPDESARLDELKRYGILDTLPEESFDRITRIVASCLDVPIALVSLVDEKRQWFKSRVGLDAQETPREVAFCAHAIMGTETLIIPDATLDPRFQDNPLVTGAPNIRFYIGAPLQIKAGYNLGTLCAIDRKPTEIDDDKKQILAELRGQ